MPGARPGDRERGLIPRSVPRIRGAHTQDVYRRVDDRLLRGRSWNGAKAGTVVRGDCGGCRAAAGRQCAHRAVRAGAVADAGARGAAGSTAGVGALVAGRYEGIDERVLGMAVDRELSIGDYVLSGGEVPALVLIDVLARLQPGALGDERSSVEESFGEGLLDWPHYTRPEVFNGRRVPAVLSSGDHAAIRRWRLKQSVGRTWLRRPELIGRAPLDAERSELLQEFLQEQREGADET